MRLALGDAPSRTWENAGRQLWRFVIMLKDQLGWTVLGALGLLLATKRRLQIQMDWLFVAFLLAGPFFFWLGNLPFDAQSTDYWSDSF